MKLATIVVFFAIGCLIAAGVHAEIYSWTDENGVKHYSHTPPANRSLPIEAEPEISDNPTDIRQTEKINEENVEAVLEELDKENKPPAATASSPPPLLSRQQRIDNEKNVLEDKLAYLESLPSNAYANSRSRDVILGQYRYRLQQLKSDPDDYFDQYGF